MLRAKLWYIAAYGAPAWIVPYMPLHWVSLGFGPEQIGLLAALRPWVSAPVGNVLSLLADRLGAHRAVLLCGLSAYVALQYTMLYASSFRAMLLLAVATATVSTTHVIIGDAAVMAAATHVSDYGRSRAFASAAWGLLGPAAGGLVARYGVAAGFRAWAWTGAAAVVAGAALPLDRLRRPPALPGEEAEEEEGMTGVETLPVSAPAAVMPVAALSLPSGPTTPRTGLRATADGAKAYCRVLDAVTEMGAIAPTGGHMTGGMPTASGPFCYRHITPRSAALAAIAIRRMQRQAASTATAPTPRSRDAAAALERRAASPRAASLPATLSPRTRTGLAARAAMLLRQPGGARGVPEQGMLAAADAGTADAGTADAGTADARAAVGLHARTESSAVRRADSGSAALEGVAAAAAARGPAAQNGAAPPPPALPPDTLSAHRGGGGGRQGAGGAGMAPPESAASQVAAPPQALPAVDHYLSSLRAVRIEPAGAAPLAHHPPAGDGQQPPPPPSTLSTLPLGHSGVSGVPGGAEDGGAPGEMPPPVWARAPCEAGGVGGALKRRSLPAAERRSPRIAAAWFNSLPREWTEEEPQSTAVMHLLFDKLAAVAAAQEAAEAGGDGVSGPPSPAAAFGVQGAAGEARSQLTQPLLGPAEVEAAAAPLPSDLLPLLLSRPVLVFFMCVTLIGYGHGVIGSFLFMYLQQLGAAPTVMGLCLTCNCFTEVPAFFYFGSLLQRVGIETVLLLAMATLAARLAAYPLLLSRSTWAVLPLELLHGVTFAAAWSASALVSSRVAPPGMESTLQALSQGLWTGVGQGMGGLAGGYLYRSIGPAAMWTASAATVAAGCLLAAVGMRNGEALGGAPQLPET